MEYLPVASSSAIHPASLLPSYVHDPALVHMLAAKLSHGSLVVVARLLLHEVRPLFSTHGARGQPWRAWAATEEAIRTLWVVCECRRD